MSIKSASVFAAIVALSLAGPAFADQGQGSKGGKDQGQGQQQKGGKDQGQDKDQGKDKDKNQGKDQDQDQGQAPGQDQDDTQQGGQGNDQDGQQANGQDQGQGQGQGQGQQGQGNDDSSKFLRIDCRYHNEENVPGVKHCYASAIYRVDGETYSDIRLGIGCDSETIFNDRGRVQLEELGERLSPKTAAFPAVEVSPKGALASYGTYESVLDISQGRLAGRCYVHHLDDRDHLPFD